MADKTPSVIEKLFPLFLFADAMAAIFYYTRIDALAQEIWSSANDQIIGSFELHHLTALVFTTILSIIPLLFYGYNIKVENLYFKSVTFYSGLMTVFLVVGNIATFMADIFINYLQFQLNSDPNNPFLTPPSNVEVIAGWALAILFPIFHQIVAGFTITGLNKRIQKTTTRSL